MNAPTKIDDATREAYRINERPRITKDFLVRRRLNELGLAAAALFGLAACKGPITHGHQEVVMGHLDELFGFTPAESQQASDMLFEATLNHSIADWDRPRIDACATELTRIASGYRGREWQDREIWAAGYQLFEIDSLWEASCPVGEGVAK